MSKIYNKDKSKVLIKKMFYIHEDTFKSRLNQLLKKNDNEFNQKITEVLENFKISCKKENDFYYFHFAAFERVDKANEVDIYKDFSLNSFEEKYQAYNEFVDYFTFFKNYDLIAKTDKALKILKKNNFIEEKEIEKDLIEGKSYIVYIKNMGFVSFSGKYTSSIFEARNFSNKDKAITYIKTNCYNNYAVVELNLSFNDVVFHNLDIEKEQHLNKLKIIQEKSLLEDSLSIKNEQNLENDQKNKTFKI